MFKSFTPEFNIEGSLKQIGNEAPFYFTPPHPNSWEDLAIAATILEGVYMDCLWGAIAGEVLDPSNHYKKMLWDYREAVQAANCVLLGAKLFARKEKKGTKDIPPFKGGEFLFNDVEAAYKIGRHLNGFEAAGRLILPALNITQHKDVKIAAMVMSNADTLRLNDLKKNANSAEINISILIDGIVKQGVSVDADDVVAVIRDAFPGVEIAPMEKTIRAIFRSVQSSPELG